MALHEDDLNEIVTQVILALNVNAKTITALTGTTSISDSDTFEIAGGKKVTFGTLKEALRTAMQKEFDDIQTSVAGLKILSAVARQNAGVVRVSVTTRDQTFTATIEEATETTAGILTAEEYKLLKKTEQDVDDIKRAGYEKVHYIEAELRNGSESIVLNVSDEQARQILHAVLPGNYYKPSNNLIVLRFSFYAWLCTEIADPEGGIINITFDVSRHPQTGEKGRFVVSIAEDPDERKIEFIPEFIEVESEEDMEKLIKDGKVEPNQKYYVKEED